jgi:hypothetical protein
MNDVILPLNTSIHGGTEHGVRDDRTTTYQPDKMKTTPAKGQEKISPIRHGDDENRGYGIKIIRVG